MEDFLRRFASALALVVRVPVAGDGEPDYSLADLWLPVAGLFAGLAGAAGLALGTLAFGPGILAAACAALAQLSASNLPRLERVLRGAGSPERAVLAGGLLLLARVGAVAALSRHGLSGYAALLAAAPAGCLAAVLAAILRPTPDAAGMAGALGDASPARAAVGFVAASVPGALLAWPAGGLAAVAGAPIAGCLLALAAATAAASLPPGARDPEARVFVATETCELAVLLAAAAAFARGA